MFRHRTSIAWSSLRWDPRLTNGVDDPTTSLDKINRRGPVARGDVTPGKQALQTVGRIGTMGWPPTLEISP